jgi:hypothetical protein
MTENPDDTRLVPSFMRLPLVITISLVLMLLVLVGAALVAAAEPALRI